jgi:hypothetical protein
MKQSRVYSNTSYQVGSGEVFSINEEPLDKVKEEQEWEDLDESSFSPSTKNEITTVAAFNHVYGVKDYGYSSGLQTKICYAHNNTNSSKHDKVSTQYSIFWVKIGAFEFLIIIIVIIME